jgi:hypothetical protein
MESTKAKPVISHVQSKKWNEAHWLELSWIYKSKSISSPPVLSMWLQTVTFIVKQSKCAGLAYEIGSSAPNSCSLPRLVNGTTQLCTSKKECKKLELTAVRYFWLVDHNDWSRWFAISSSHVYANLVIILLVGFHKKTAKLRCLILLSRVAYWAPLEML